MEVKTMAEKKNQLTREGLRKYEEELHELKSVRRKEVAEKIKEAREQGDLSENAEYDAARDEQRNIEARIEELEDILKNAEVIDVDQTKGKITKVFFGATVRLEDIALGEEVTYTIKGSSEANIVDDKTPSISNESPLGKALLEGDGVKKGATVLVDAPDKKKIEYKVLDIWKE